MNIFVSNINYATKDHQLQELFEGYGEVSSTKIITDRDSGRSKGFGFLPDLALRETNQEMPNFSSANRH